jgi:glycosyltransferase involved in cell wall biosynthesis
MKIGFDGKRAAQNFTGLGNYSRYVLKLLAGRYSANEYFVYSPKPLHARLAGDFSHLPCIHFKYAKSKLLKSWWRSFGIVSDLKKDNIDVYHGLSNELPFGIKKAGIPCVVTIHDLIFLRYPQYYNWPDRKIYKFKSHYACMHADKIIAISEQTKRDIIRFLNISENKIEVVYQNCDPIFHQKASLKEKAHVRSAYHLPAKYLLNVGTIEPRKNLMLIVKALKQTDAEIHLVVIGKETPYAQKVKEFVAGNGLEKRVHFLKNIPFHDLPAIYQQAELFIYPSEFEGFGIPVVEALHSGIPVIAAAGSCLEEAGGPGSIYIDPKNDMELAETIQMLLQNPDKRQVMINSGEEHLKQFSDENTARQLMHFYQNTIDNA